MRQHLSALVAMGMAVTAVAQPISLRVEGLDANVAFISEPHPRFSFLHGASRGRGITQKTYRITVTKTAGPGKHGVLMWDSGNVSSTNCSQIEYAGANLTPYSAYEWTAEWTASDGTKSAQAKSLFETGPMSAADWGNGAFLWGPNDQFRLAFELPSVPVRARGYVAAAGCHHLEVNGMVPAPDLRGICPWAVNSTQTVRYQTRVITSAVAGKNVIGLLAGSVMTSTVAVLGVFFFELGDGKTISISTATPGWMARPSYVTSSSAWETDIDWTQQEAGWSSPGFTPSSKWTAAVTQPTSISPRALAMPLTTVLNEVRPISAQAIPNTSAWLYTFPKNFVGTVRVNSALPNAEAGASLEILAGEWLGGPAPPPSVAGRCEKVDENAQMLLGGCPSGQTISTIEFASFGTPTGHCPHFTINQACHLAGSLKVISDLCLGKQSCKVEASVKTFKADPCHGVKKTLAAVVRCSGDPPGPAPPAPPPPQPYLPQISGGKQQYERHLLRPGNTKPLETLFCWHGFQYVLVTALNGATGFEGKLTDIVGLEIHTNMTATGTLEFGGRSADVLNGIQMMTLNSQVTNVAAYMPTDCPTREKHGWMGDALDASEECMYNFDSHTVHEAFLQTVTDNQGSNGDVPVVIPNPKPKAGCNDIAWTAAFPQITHFLYKYYGDRRVVEVRWPSLVDYIENLIQNAEKSTSSPGLAVCDRFNDWLCGQHQSCCSNLPVGTSCPVGQEMGGFNYVLALRAMADMANLLGKTAQAARFTSLSENATAEFHKVFYEPAYHTYGGDNGAVQSLTLPALVIDSAPTRSIQQRLLADLDNDLANPGMNQSAYTLRVGAVTSKVLLDVLSSNGLHDTALKLATQTAEPSWGWWWTQNATTCWEAWPGGEIPGDSGGTHNHIFLCGGIGEWFWKHLVGLTPTTAAFATVQIAPKVRPALGPTSVKAEFVSARGPIQSSWEVEEDGKRVTLNVSLPVGVESATIMVPKPFTDDSTQAAKAIITEGGQEVWDGTKLVQSARGILSAMDTPSGVAFKVSNGEFFFTSTIASSSLMITTV